MATGEFVGGPRDGEQFTVPGPLPPQRIQVMDVAGGRVTMWHPARGDEVPFVVCVLEPDERPNGPWRYRWPRAEGTSQ